MMKLYYNCSGFLVCSFVVLTIIGIKSGIAQRLDHSQTPNEFCKARPTLVAIDAPSFRKFPFYIMLQRCGGSASYVSPLTQYCAVNTSEDVKVEVASFDYTNTRKDDVMIMKNHTSCMHKCVNTKEMCDPEYEYWKPSYCSCECKYDTGPPEGCPDKFRWNPHLCKCECDYLPNAQKCNEQKKFWNDDLCRCSCSHRVTNRCKRKNKNLDENTCQCVDKVLTVGARQGDTDCVSQALLFGVMLGELVLVLLLVEICLYMKGLGVIQYLLKGTSSRRSTDKLDQAANRRLSHDTTTYL